MDSNAINDSAPSFDLGIIYYTFFRHKWKIIVCSLLGFVAAFAAYHLITPLYVSEAKLFIRYVITEGKSLGPGRDDSITKSPDQRGETIISSELEILTSRDLAEQVVKNIGAEKMLAKAGGGKDAALAAALIQRNLLVEVPRNSSVIRVAFNYPDPDIVQVVLKELVESYLRKHVEIHRAVGIVGDFLTQETDQLRSRLAQTEEELRKATNKAGIISLEDYKKTIGEQSARLKQQTFDLQAELAERMSVYNEMTKGLPKQAAPAEANNPAPLPPEQITAYQNEVARLGQLRQRLQELLTKFTEDSPPIQLLRQQVKEAETHTKALETQFPALARTPGANATSPRGSADEYNAPLEGAKINALQARLKILNGQMDEIRADAAKVDQQEIPIQELRRRKELEEANYRYYSANLEQSRINEALGTGRVSNISLIEAPTPPARDAKKTPQILAGIAVSGIVLGLAWAVAIEFFLDRSIRRPAEIERLLRAPLFISIPQFKLKAGKKARPAKAALPAPAAPPAALSSAAEPGPAAPAGPSDPSGSVSSELQQLVPFHQTLRDRLINYFDSINLRHKPKLIAVTGLGRNSGVTTTATGLARSLSETGEGNVLLVDMTQGQGSAQNFQRGTQVGLEQLLDTRNSAFVHSNLYVVSEHSGGERLSKGLPQRFNQLVPKLKASDFDYIIFDMPAVNQISITPRLASFMDLTLLVVESEKTDREIAAHASALLAKNNTRVGVVMNKSKSYVPSGLHQERDFLLGT